MTKESTQLRQQLEYCHKRMAEAYAEISRLKEYIQRLEKELGVEQSDEYQNQQEEAAKNFGGI